jgi:predicted RecA/RadA family phage recombinase
MKINFEQDGQTIPTIAGVGGIEIGDLVDLGHFFGRAATTGLEGETVSVDVSGAYLGPKAAVTITRGEALYAGASSLTNVPPVPAVIPVGMALADAAELDAEVFFLLNGASEDTEVPATIVTMAAAGGVAELLETPAADRAAAKSGIVKTNVVQNTDGAAASGDLLMIADGATKKIKASAAKVVDFATAAQGGKADTAVQPADLDLLPMPHLYGFTGKNLAGACTLTGAKAGDLVSGIVNVDGTPVDAAKFETTITVNDQIQQIAAEDLSLVKYMTIILTVPAA